MPARGYMEAPSDQRARAGVGVFGYGFMGKAHSNALRTLTYIDWRSALRPDLVAVAGRRQELASEAATRFGFAGCYPDWRGLVEDERISIFDNAAADEVHVEPTLAAITAGKHVSCEKPLARNSADARRMWLAAEQAGVKHLCTYNYRFVPAVRLARAMLRRGELGDVFQARFRYSQDGRPPSPVGALRTIGCHAIDQARFLVGEITSVSAMLTNPVITPDRPSDVDAAWPGQVVTAVIGFDNGACGTIDASNVSYGRRNMLAWEINCDQGTLQWDLERLNELRVTATRTSHCSVDGLLDVIVCEPDHPYMDLWWPSGHLLGWEHAHINMFIHFLRCIAEDRAVDPDGATFYDGYRTALICDAMDASARLGRRVDLGIEHTANLEELEQAGAPATNDWVQPGER